MQSMSSAFTAEERNSTRSVTQKTFISWKKENALLSRTFTIEVSTIGGNHIIGINPGAIGSPGNYKYFEETDNVLSASWERGLSQPMGGISMALADLELDNTSGRYTPRYLGGNSELFTAIEPRKPMIINAGFVVNGISDTIPQFSGIVRKMPVVRSKDKTIELSGADYIEYFSNRYLDQSLMFTGQTTSTIVGTLLAQAGMSTAQYDLDTGINTIPYAYFEKGTKFYDAINDLVAAENGQFYQDEEGILRFENRQHWNNAPHTNVQKVITTGQVLEYKTMPESSIINVVEVRAQEYQKQPLNVLINYSIPVFIKTSERIELFFEYDDPVLQVVTPTVGGTNSYYTANTDSGGVGVDYSSSVQLKYISTFTKNSKLVFENTSDVDLYITRIVISGRVAKNISDAYIRRKDDSSVTAYEERPMSINNPFIQNRSWANSLAQIILDDYGEPQNIQMIKIRAIPSLQLGDLISWQGRYWRIIDIQATLDTGSGFIQNLTLVQRTITNYFMIGVSTIGGVSKISA